MHGHLELTVTELVAAYTFIDQEQQQGSVFRTTIAFTAFVLKADSTEAKHGTTVDTIGIAWAVPSIIIHKDQQHTVGGLLEGNVPLDELIAMACSPFMVVVDCSTSCVNLILFQSFTITIITKNNET